MNSSSGLGLSELGLLTEPAVQLLANVPPGRNEKSDWLRQLGANEDIATHLMRVLGRRVAGLDLPFECLLHGGCFVTLTRGRNGQIVYHDRSLASRKREFQTIPELAAARFMAEPRRLRPLQLALWSVRLLHEGGLIRLPLVTVPAIPQASRNCVHRAREGFELLVRCRWFLDPGEPVAFSRGFVESWCGIPVEESRFAIYSLIGAEVIKKVSEARSNFKNATSLYLPRPRGVVAG